MVATATHELKPFNRPPQLHQLFRQVACEPGVHYKWREIGLRLKIPNVDDIMEIFCQWKERGHPPYTWATILDVLKSPEVDEVELAQELEQWLVRQ